MQQTNTYVDKAIDAIYDELRSTGEGSRNGNLFKKAARAYEFVYGGYLPENEVTESLKSIADGLGLKSNEIQDSLKSARLTASKNPAVIPDTAPAFDVTSLFKNLDKEVKAQGDNSYALQQLEALRNNSAQGHEYLTRKKLAHHHGLFFTGKDKHGAFLAHTLFDTDFAEVGFERIYSNNKMVSKGAGKNGAYFGAVQPASEQSKTCYLTEGYADALSIAEVTDCDCYSATSSSNIGRVAEFLSSQYEQVICALDNDEAGKDVASKLSGKFECVMPSKLNDYSDVFVSGGDMLAELQNKPSLPKSETVEAFTLDSFVMDADLIEKRLEEMKHHTFVLDELAIMGQITIFYAPPNSGKTLLTLALIIDAVKTDKVNGEDVFYINADDGGSGAMTKAKILAGHSIKPITLSENGFTPEKLELALETMCARDEAKGKVVIIDTLKKFTDVMSKTSLSQFMTALRKFAMSGGTAIALAHTNKKRDAEGKVVFGGTSDSMDDTDCAYSIDVVQEAEGTRTEMILGFATPIPTEKRVVLFENLKKRGDNDKEASYQYEVWKGAKYQDMIDSVCRMDTDIARAKAQELQKQIQHDLKKAKLNDDALEVYEFIVANGGEMLKTDIYSNVPKELSISRRKVRSCVDLFEGELWTIRKDVSAQYVKAMNR